MKSFKELSKVKDKILDSIDDNFDPTLDIDQWKSAGGLNSNAGRQYIKQDQVSVRLSNHLPAKKQSANPRATHIVLRFGLKIFSQLNLKKGDVVELRTHPQDESCFILIPRPNGYKIVLETASNAYTVRISWNNPLNLPITSSQSTDYGIHEKGYLMFRLPQSFLQWQGKKQ